MAIRYAVASGNWSNPAIWNGGTLPAATDDVYANTFTVNIDQDVTVNSLKKASLGSPVLSPGGTFIITAAVTLTITAGVVATDNITNFTQMIQVNAGSAAVVINANMTGGAASSRTACSVLSTHTGTVTVNGNLTGGTGDNSLGMSSVGTTACTVIINGNVTGGSTTGAYGYNNIGATTATINGSVTGGVVPAVNNFAAGALTIRGSLRPGPGVSNVGTPAVSGTTGILRVSGDIYTGNLAPSSGVAGYFPITVPWAVIDGEDTRLHLFKDDFHPVAIGGTQAVLSLTGTSNPDESDVRSGVTYGPDGTLIGSLAVPDPASVYGGVPTDDTVGTGFLSRDGVIEDLTTIIGAIVTQAATRGP